MAKASALQPMLIEAKRAGFPFRIFEGDAQRVLAADQVEVGALGITYSDGDEECRLLYRRMSVQVLPESKTANILVSPPTQLIIIAASAPAFITLLLYQNRTSLHSLFGVSQDYLEGFSLALLFASYAVMLATQFYIWHSRSQREIRAASSVAPLIAQLEKASDVEQYFSRLIQVNLKNMDQYYLLVRSQTEKSYRLTQAAAIVGFAVLVAGIVLSFKAGLQSVPTALTIASGILIEFISAIFFYIYNRTIRQLNTYHDKLVSVQDTMLALKVAQIVSNTELKDTTMAYLTRALTGRLRERELSAASSSAESPLPGDKGVAYSDI